VVWIGRRVHEPSLILLESPLVEAEEYNPAKGQADDETR
jgi:hypothetical protein